MSPEQFAESRAVDPTADVYSAGCTLFHMLAGRPPFLTTDYGELIELHRSESPPALHDLMDTVGTALSYVVEKALEKRPELRYQTAGDMLHDIERVMNAKPIRLKTLPSPPETDQDQVRNFNFEWELGASVASLWPLIADTDRFNQAIGLPAPAFEYDHSGARRKIFATANFNGMKVRWLEHPFHWIVEKELSVLREFETGPFVWAMSTVQLSPLLRDRTRVSHRISVLPRGWLGKLITPIQIGWQTRRALKGVYQRIEAIANTNDVASCDVPFGKPITIRQSQRNILSEKTLALTGKTGNSGWSKKLADYLGSASDPAVARISPAHVSRVLETSLDAAVEFCLQAVDCAILSLTWEVICPICKVASARESFLASIKSHSHCQVCNLSFDVDFSESIELVFQVDSSVREVTSKVYCIGGPFHAPHVLAQQVMQPGIQNDIGVSALEGEYVVMSPQLEEQVHLAARELALRKRAEVVLGSSKTLTNNEIDLATGPVCVSVANKTDSSLHVRIEKQVARDDAVTAAVAAQHPLFRKLFPDQVSDLQNLAEVAHMYLLFVSIPDIEALVDKHGDVKVRLCLDWIASVLVEETGVGVPAVIEQDHLLVAFDKADELAEAVLRLKNAESRNELFEMACSIALINYGKVHKRNQVSKTEVFGKVVRQTKRLGVREVSPGLLVCREFLESADAPALIESLSLTAAGSEAELSRFEWPG